MNIVTPQFIASWFIFAWILFILIKCFYWKNEIPRDWNAAAILFSQGLGATIAYALY